MKYETINSKERGASVLGIILVLGVLAGVSYVWWKSIQESHAVVGLDRARLVTVERRELIDAVKASGRVEPVARVAVMSRASGIIKSLHVEEGDVVTAGQLLAELDRERLEAQLAQDRANLASASARKQLRGNGVSLRDVDDAERQLVAAHFRVQLVEASLPVLNAALEGARADFDAARASLDRAETALQEASIFCPIDGVVLVRDTEVGDGVSSILTAGGNATQLMTLGDLSHMHVEARVDEVDLGRITPGMPAIVTVDAHRC